jgi:hypothetical protein
MADLGLSHALSDFYRRRADTLACPGGDEAGLLRLVHSEDAAFQSMLAQPPPTLRALVEKFDAVLSYAAGPCDGELNIEHAERLLRDLRRLLAS